MEQDQPGRAKVLARKFVTSRQRRRLDRDGPNTVAARDQLFICYSHADAGVLEEMRVHLRALKRESSVKFWDDSHIRPGTKWRDEIRRALETTRAALLLVSPDFLASDFVMNDEVPTLLKAAEDNGVVIICLILRPCLFEKFESLSRFQTVNSPDKPLSKLTRYQRERTLVTVAGLIDRAFES